MGRTMERRRNETRRLYITKALLLGYEFKWGVFSRKGVYLVKPNGYYYAPHLHLGATAFPAAWVAAKQALILSGVLPDAEKSRGDERAHSRKSDRFRQR